MHAGPLLQERSFKIVDFLDPNYYWVEMMGRRKPGVGLDQAQAALAGPFGQWVVTTASNDVERANLPELRLAEGAAGLDSLRRQYSKPLYVLLSMVGLILAIACANTASLLLARAATRTREMAVRLSLGAGRWRVVRQLLTESVLLAALSAALGIAIAMAGIRLLTGLLANGRDGFTLHAELNGHVLGVTLALSLACGVLFGLAPALQATRPVLVGRLDGRSISGPSARQALVVAQIAISLLLLVGAGLFVRTLSNLQSVSLGFNRERVLLFDVNAPQAGYPESRVADFYADLRRRLSGLPGATEATWSHASLIRAGRGHPVTVDGQPAKGTRILWTGPRFFTTLQIPILRGREIEEGDRQGTRAVAVVSERFARTWLGEANPIGRLIEVGGSLRVDGVPSELEIVGVAANAQYGVDGRSEASKNNDKRSMKPMTSEEAKAEVVHPVVRTHPETGRKALYVNVGFTTRFDGWTKDESRPLLRWLYEHCAKPEFTCRFGWAKNSVAFWDNRCAQHYALNDYHGFRREMHRVTVEGDRPH
jgi:predicted permease